MTEHLHRYATHAEWTGSTADGWAAYNRNHVVHSPPAVAQLGISADPTFKGDATLYNPEQLIVAAASSCQMLSFLAEACRVGIDVVGYTDDAEGVMPHTPPRMSITRITLRPRITVRGDVDEAAVHAAVERGHAGCFIANSLVTEVVVEATIATAV